MDVKTKTFLSRGDLISTLKESKKPLLFNYLNEKQGLNNKLAEFDYDLLKTRSFLNKKNNFDKFTAENFDLDSLLDSRKKGVTKAKQQDYAPTTPIVGFSRNKNEQINSLEGSSIDLLTERFFGQSEQGFNFLFDTWNPKRKAKIVPLKIEKTSSLEQRKSKDYELLPTHVKDLFNEGNILRTSSENSSDYQAMMYVEENFIPGGRTGVLLHKGKPVTVNIEGKEFIVEIKGVGVPNGDNSVTEVMARSSFFGQGRAKYGGLEVEQAVREFRNLEMLRELNGKTFSEKNSPRAALMLKYDGGVRYWGDDTNQGYLLRLSPSSIRASFNDNESLPEIKNKSRQIALAIADQYVEYLNLERPLVHHCMHSENLVLTNQGYKFTDFSDARLLSDIAEPHELAKRVFVDFVDEIPNRTDDDIKAYSKRLAKGLGLRWSKNYEDTTKFAEAIWTKWLAPKVAKLRISGTNSALEGFLKEYSEQYNLSAPEFDEEIIRRGKIKFHNVLDEISTYREIIVSLGHQISRLEELSKNPAQAIKEYANHNHMTEEKAVNLAKGKCDELRQDYSDHVMYLKEEQEALRNLKACQGKPRESVINVRFTTAIIRDLFYTAKKYLENEIDVFKNVKGERETQIVTNARAKLKEIKLLQKKDNGYALVDKLKENPNYVLQQLINIY